MPTKFTYNGRDIDFTVEPGSIIEGKFGFDFMAFTEEVIAGWVGKPLKDTDGNVLGTIIEAWTVNGGESVMFRARLNDA